MATLNTLFTDMANVIRSKNRSNATNAVVIGSSGAQPKVCIKQNDTWAQYSKIFKKVNGSWIEQSSSSWDTVLSAGNDYRIIEI